MVYLVACLYILYIYLKSYKTITTNGFIFIYTQGALHIQSICNWVQLEVHTRGFGRIDHKKSPYQIWEGKAFHHGHKSNTRACGRANPFPKTLENEPVTSDHVQVWKTYSSYIFLICWKWKHASPRREHVIPDAHFRAFNHGMGLQHSAHSSASKQAWNQTESRQLHLPDPHNRPAGSPRLCASCPWTFGLGAGEAGNRVIWALGQMGITTPWYLINRGF